MKDSCSLEHVLEYSNLKQTPYIKYMMIAKSNWWCPQVPPGGLQLVQMTQILFTHWQGQVP